MRYDGLDLNLLVALDALLELRSVSAAGKRLNLSQPAVTGALNRLRDYFADDLLVSRGRQMYLTARSEELIGPVRRALMQVRSEITQPGGFDIATTTRRFVIVASDYAYTIAIADLICKASELAPNISFEIIAPDSGAMDRFERAEIDLLVTVDAFSLPSHPKHELWRDKEVLISWTGAGYTDIDRDTLFEAGHVITFFGPERRPGLIETMLDDMGLSRRVEVFLPSFTALPQAIVGTRRLASMHQRYAEHFAKLYPISLHPYPIKLKPVIEVLQWHDIRSKDQGNLWLRGLLSKCAAALQADR